MPLRMARSHWYDDVEGGLHILHAVSYHIKDALPNWPALRPSTLAQSFPASFIFISRRRRADGAISRYKALLLPSQILRDWLRQAAAPATFPLSWWRGFWMRPSAWERLKRTNERERKQSRFLKGRNWPNSYKIYPRKKRHYIKFWDPKTYSFYEEKLGNWNGRWKIAYCLFTNTVIKARAEIEW